MNAILTTSEIEAIREAGFSDASEATSESQDGGAPDGGWDSWLISGVGTSEAVRLLCPDRLLPTGDVDLAEWVEADGEALWTEICGAYDAGGDLAGERFTAGRAADLDAAGVAGYRVCVFGLPGSSVHEAEVSGPGEADAVSARIYQPGPCGPYDSAILTPCEADAVRYLDGSRVYEVEVEAALHAASAAR